MVTDCEDYSATHLSSIIGNFGKWQCRLIGVVCIVGAPIAWQILVLSFLAAETDYWCSPLITKGSYENLDAWESFSSPKSTKEKGGYDKCNIFDIDYSNLSADQLKGHASDISNITRPCNDWTFDLSFYQETILSQFDLVCNRDWYITVQFASFMFGVMVGAISSGILNDKFGRRKMLLYYSLLQVLFGIIVAFSPNISFYIAIRWCLGFLNNALFSTAFVYCMEIVGGKMQTVVGIGLEFPWALGYAVLPGLAYLIPHWSHLQIAITSPLVLMLIFLYLIPESPRWLLTSGHYEEAFEILKKAVKMNGNKDTALMNLERLQASVKISNGDNPSVSSSKISENRNILDLFRTPRLRKRTLIQYIIWFTNSFVYYGFTLQTSSRIPGGSLHLEFMISGLIEFPAYALTMFMLLYSGRRWPLFGTMLLAGISLLLTQTLNEKGTALLVLVNIGKFGITCSFAIIYVYAAELFPTVVRSTGVGSCSMCARIGSILAPIMTRSLVKVYEGGPIIVFGITSVLGAVLALLLPETRNKALPDTIENAENVEDDQTISCCCNFKKVFQVNSSTSVDNSNGNPVSMGLSNRGFSE